MNDVYVGYIGLEYSLQKVDRNTCNVIGNWSFLPQSRVEYFDWGQSIVPWQNDVILTQRFIGEFAGQYSCEVVLHIVESVTYRIFV